MKNLKKGIAILLATASVVSASTFVPLSVGAVSVSRVTWYTGAQGHGIQFVYTKFLLFFCLIFCLYQHRIPQF